MRTASDISSAYVTERDGQIENAGAVRLESRCQIGELRSAHSCVRSQSPPDELRVCDGICMDCHLERTHGGQYIMTNVRRAMVDVSDGLARSKCRSDDACALRT